MHPAISGIDVVLISVQLEEALGASKHDVRDASAGVLKDLKRFQGEKEEDLKRYMVCPC